MRLIDADLLWKEFDTAHLFDDGNPRHIAQQTVEEQPTVDAVKVVRCKDCKWCKLCYPAKAIGEEAIEEYYCNMFKQYREPDDFCSYGELKERVNNG